jgi:hypothetical protein
MRIFSQGKDALRNPRDSLNALLKLLPVARDWPLSLSQKLDKVFGDNEAVKCVLAANSPIFTTTPPRCCPSSGPIYCRTGTVRHGRLS